MSLVLAVGLVTVACSATGPSYAEIAASIPDVPNGHGRVFFYREDALIGAAVQPDIELNGDVVGESEPGGFFFVDRLPGHYRVACSTEWEHAVEFDLVPSQLVYVKTTIGLGVLVSHIYPEIVGDVVGMISLRQCVYTGPPLAIAAVP